MTSTQPKTFTAEQQAVIAEIQFGTGSLRVEALAGAAKTTTIEAGVHALDPSPGEVLAVAFNKRIAEELKERLPFTCSTATLNSIGHRAWGGMINRKIQLDANKLYHLTTEALQAARVHEDEFIEVGLNVRRLVDGARNVGLIPASSLHPSMQRPVLEDSWENWEAIAENMDCDFNEAYLNHARNVLRTSIKRAFEGYIDFPDQLYMSTCWNATFPQFRTVIVDEAQDLSVLNHHMLARMIAPGGRLIAVGDRFQSIYAFRGASLTSMDLLAGRFKMKTMTLSTTFRCCKAVVEHVKDRVPHIQAPSWAIEGHVTNLGTDWEVSDILPGSAIICRNNKPLIKLAYRFLKAGKPVVINGGDFGEVLIKLLKKMAGATSSSEKKNETRLVGMNIGQLMHAIDEWETKEISDARAKRKDYRIGSIEDKAGSLRVCVELCKGTNALEVLQELTQIFGNKVGTVILSSGHKSKGLEWETVYHLDSHLCPSRYALRKAEAGDNGALEQELNLRYVISTRAKARLLYIDSDREGEKELDSREDNIHNMDAGNCSSNPNELEVNHG